MNIAIVHDWLISRGGAENTLAQILGLFPEADLFSLLDFIPAGERDFLLNKKVQTSFLQKLPFAKTKYRNYLPLMPLAVERFNLSAYDLIISSSHAAAKGVVTRPGQLHLCYCYTPFRYAWDLREQYLRETGLDRGIKGFAARALLSRVRRWDAANSLRVDHFATLSEYIRARIKRAYNRDSEIIYPPVDTEFFTLNDKKEDFYVTVSRLVPYKKVDLIVKAFSGMPGKRLVVIGIGPDLKKIKQAAGPNVEFRMCLDDKTLALCLQKARAFVFAAEEDFGIAPLEAQACGTPVIAYGKGGLLETVRGKFSDERKTEAEPLTGVFFRDQTAASIIDAVHGFETLRFDPAACRENSLRFSKEKFRSKFKLFVERKLSEQKGGRCSRFR